MLDVLYVTLSPILTMPLLTLSPMLTQMPISYFLFFSTYYPEGATADGNIEKLIYDQSYILQGIGCLVHDSALTVYSVIVYG